MTTITNPLEAKMLRLLQAVFKRGSSDRAAAIVRGKEKDQAHLSLTSLELVKDALVKGSIGWLAKQGWRNERFLREGHPVEGRLWERTEAKHLPLKFSRHSIGLLKWLTTSVPSPQHQYPVLKERPFTVGDHLLFFWAYQSLRTHEIGKMLKHSLPFAHNGLIRMAFPIDFAVWSEGTRPGAKLEFWFQPENQWILEAFQATFAQAWRQTAIEKEKVKAVELLRSIGQHEAEILKRWSDLLLQTNRRDLAFFAIDAARDLLEKRPEPQHWVGWIPVANLRLADRSSFYEDVLALLRHLDQLRTWDRELRGVGYFDEGYAASQYWKSQWSQRQAENVSEHAHRIVRSLQPLSLG